MRELHGRVAAKLENNVDTDVIYPGRYLNITDREKTSEHLFELAYPDLRSRIQPGDILVAGKNFGCGSSREQATAAVKYSGFGAVIAVSFARIFFRNSVNLGLPVIVSPEAAAALEEGSRVSIDVTGGIVHNEDTGETFKAAALDPKAAEILEAGGLVPYLKRKYGTTS